MPKTAERWTVEAGDADVATLVVPPVLRRTRVVDIDVRLQARVVEAGPAAWLALRVEVDGRLEWTRRIEARAPVDSLDHHCRRTLGPGRALRVLATAQLGGTVGERLTIEVQEADEAG